jgi:hypothetical protein
MKGFFVIWMVAAVVGLAFWITVIWAIINILG